MGHSLTHFFMDRGSFVRYVVIDCFPLSFVSTDLVRNKVRRALPSLLLPPVLTGMGLPQYLRLHLMCSRVVSEGIEGMEFVS